MLYYSVGSALLSEEELHEQDRYLNIGKFLALVQEGKRPKKGLTLPTGELKVADAITMMAGPPGVPAVPLEPIGLGKPLSIQITEVYTGRYPIEGLFSSKQDMLLTSAIKSVAHFEAKPRAINFLKKGVEQKSRLASPGASEQGTPLLFYSPALLDRSLILDLTIVFDRFPSEVFDHIGDAFLKAGGIPIFLAQSAYLIAAGILAKIVGRAGEALFDGEPVFDQTEILRIEEPGYVPLVSRFCLITDRNVDRINSRFRHEYQVNQTGLVVDRSGNRYDGDIPYIVILINGTKREDFASFAPTAATAAVLSRFFGLKNGQTVPLDYLIDALKLYSDLQFRHEVDQIDERLKALPSGTEKDALKQKRKALEENIMDQLLKPKAL